MKRQEFTNPSRFSVMSYNTKEALADPKRSDEVLRFVESEGPDVGVLHSAYWTRPNSDAPFREEESPVLARFVSQLGTLGYEVTCRDEADATNRPDKTGFVGFVRAELGTGSVFEGGLRQGYLATVTDPESGREVRVGGLHYTDTDETSRLAQTAKLPDVDILLIDGNSMHRHTRMARALRALRPLTDLVPDLGDRDHNALTRLGRVWADAHTAQSLVWMADGSNIQALEDRGFVDADSSYAPTIQKFGIGVAQLDYIFYTPESVSVSGHQVHKNIRESDHWPISGVVQVNPTDTAV